MVVSIGMTDHCESSVPFACTDDAGHGDASHVIKKRAIRCALSRICGVCGETLNRPVAFLGPRAEAEDNRFAFPALHLSCARDAATARAGAASGHLGHVHTGGAWVMVTTGGFDLIRPRRRGDPVCFSPNSVLEVLEA